MLDRFVFQLVSTGFIAVFRSERYRGGGDVAPKKGFHPFASSIKPVLN
jgi:hypothetical protein